MSAAVIGATMCSRENCWAPETPCVLGELDGCQHFVAPSAEVFEEDSAEGQPVPWSGLALGLADLFPVAALGRPHVVGIVGAAGSGKTTLLAAHWAAARRGLGEFSKDFAGSYSLTGWHQIARHLQWQPYGSGFPPHTSASDDRSPALLHMAYAETAAGVQQHTRHLLFTDAPGEWFSRWAEDPALAEGARWIADHADSFLLLADGEALASAARGQARTNYRSLAIRLHTAAAGRPVLPILTKADVDVPERILAAVNKLNRRLFDTNALEVSAHDPERHASIVKPVDLAVRAAFAPRYATPGAADAWMQQMAVQPWRSRR